jgi:hypothetical protein
MATASPNLPMENAFRAALNPINAFSESLMMMQALQLDVLLFWQKSMVDFNRELWDQWTCRWAGGVPIDG